MRRVLKVLSASRVFFKLTYSKTIKGDAIGAVFGAVIAALVAYATLDCVGGAGVEAVSLAMVVYYGVVSALVFRFWRRHWMFYQHNSKVALAKLAVGGGGPSLLGNLLSHVPRRLCFFLNRMRRLCVARFKRSLKPIKSLGSF